MVSVMEVYSRLLHAYGEPQWWSDIPYQVMVEAVLVQHTTWSSVEKMRQRFGDKIYPAYIMALPQEKLEELIRPCGFQKAKSRTIKAITEWFIENDCDTKAICARPLEQVRAELLKLRGVGAETADVILVYALCQPSFIVDAYTRIFLKRLEYSFENDSSIRAFFENSFGKDVKLYGGIHWLILEHCIVRCKKKQECEKCPFGDCCISVVGVDGI